MKKLNGTHSKLIYGSNGEFSKEYFTTHKALIKQLTLVLNYLKVEAQFPRYRNSLGVAVELEKLRYLPKTSFTVPVIQTKG